MIVGHRAGLGAALRVGVRLSALGLPMVDERLDGQPVVGRAITFSVLCTKPTVVRLHLAISVSSRSIKSQSGWP